MSTQTSPGDVLNALIHIEDNLPSLVGEDGWQKISHTLSSKLDQLRHSTEEPEQLRLSAELVGLLAPYPDARELLQTMIHAETQRRAIGGLNRYVTADLASVATQLRETAESVQPSLAKALESVKVEPVASESAHRLITIAEGGIDKAKSIKLGNLRLDLDELTELAPGVVLVVGDKVMGQTNPLLIIAGILLIVRSLVKAMTIEISEREASVFWGFVKARDAENIAGEVAILKHTNEERRKVGLEPLTNNQVKNALHKLASLKSVDVIGDKPGAWRIIENYKINH